MAGLLPCCSCLLISQLNKIPCLNCFFQCFIQYVVWYSIHEGPGAIIDTLTSLVAKVSKAGILMFTSRFLNNHVVNKSSTPHPFLHQVLLPRIWVNPHLQAPHQSLNFPFLLSVTEHYSCFAFLPSVLSLVRSFFVLGFLLNAILACGR